jgi:hypothetical protein
MDYRLLADLIAVVHLGYVAFVVLGEAVILLGLVRKWHWVRNVWFRTAHLAAISLVALEAAMGMRCPLTDWERNLRAAVGETVSEASFLARLANDILFFAAPEWVFRTAHLVFALLVIATFVLAPPRIRAAETAALGEFRARAGKVDSTNPASKAT